MGKYVNTLIIPLGTKNRIKSNKKRLIETSNKFFEGWAGVGIIIEIWAVAFGIITSGILPL
jgi:hypothetical protein